MLSFLKKLLALLLALAMLALGILFALQNPQAVPLDILVLQLPPQSLALWVLAALALGACLGLLSSSLTLLRMRARLAAARRQATQAQADLKRASGQGAGGS